MFNQGKTWELVPCRLSRKSDFTLLLLKPVLFSDTVFAIRLDPPTLFKLRRDRSDNPEITSK